MWYMTHPAKTKDSPEKQEAYYGTFYVFAPGQECLCDLRHFVDLMPLSTPEQALAKVRCQDLLDYVRASAGVRDDVDLIRAEGSVAEFRIEEEPEKQKLLEPTYAR